MKPQAPEKEKEKKKEKEKEKEKDKKKKDSSIKMDIAQKEKSKPSEEKKRLESSLSPISKKRRISKRILLKLAEDYSSKDKASPITAEPMNAATHATKLATRPSRPV